MVYLYTIEYYSAIRENAIMPCVPTWENLVIMILNEISKILHDISYRWDLKYDTNELIYKTETDSQT